MADEKEPQSLNQRNNRLIQDFSTSQARRPPRTENGKPVKLKLEGRRRLCKVSIRDDDDDDHFDAVDDDVPHFSGITDFDSSPEEKPTKVKMEGRRRLCKVSSKAYDQDDSAENRAAQEPDEPKSYVPSDFDSPALEKNVNVSDKCSGSEIRDILNDLSSKFDFISTEKKRAPKSVNLVDNSAKNEVNKHEKNAELPEYDHFDAFDAVDDDVPHFSGITDFDSSPEEKPTKVKMEGRRRLCKVSSKADDQDDSAENRAVQEPDEPKSYVPSDFDSPALEKNVNVSDKCSGSEIRDILNDLSSKFDFMSIEKKRAPKSVNLVDNSAKNEVNKHEKNAELPEYESASSSLSAISDQSDSSPTDITNQSIAGVGVLEEEDNEPSESESFSFESKILETKYVDKGQIKNETRRLNVKSGFEGKSFVSNVDNDDDDCVVVSNTKFSKNAYRKGSKFEGVSDLLDGSDEMDDFDVKDEISITLSDPRSTYKLPGKVAKMLYPHQRDGMKWLWSLHCQGKGGILGDDMGLGKTMQICGFLAGLFNSSLIKRALIVAPKTLLPHWIKELSVVGLSEKTREYFGTCVKTRQYELQYILQDKGVLLTTYDIVRNNTKALRGDFYYHNEQSEEDNTIWDYMILDEGHLIKNPSTQRAKSLLEIPSAHRIIISGTPIQNNLKELWALFNFCCPELLGDKKWFKDRYETPILHGNDKNATDREKRTGSTVAKELREHIQPYFLRRLKSEVFHEDDNAQTAKLSKKNEIIVWLRLTSCQRQLYEAFLNSEIVLSAFDGSPLAALTILKKICDHPLLLTKRAADEVLEGMDSMLNQEDHGVAEKLAMHIADITEKESFQEKHDYVSCKISFILALLDNLIPQGHNVLIFSQTRKMLNLLQESLVSKGYEFLRIDGTTKASDRLKIVNEFQEGNTAPIFLLTSQVGGLGLTLTKADRVIVVDPAWNPSTDNQSVDRAYRIGQKKDVLVYRLMTCGTVEEKIYRKQIYKGGLFKSATEHKEQIRYFSQQDLRELLSLPKQGFDVSLTQQQLHEEHDSQHTMDESLKAHIKMLETQGIVGVSHHSLLFSKTAPVPVVQEEEEAIRNMEYRYIGKSSSSSSLERNVNGAEHAFNPKDVKLYRKNTTTDSGGKLSESEIKERINRLSHVFANKVTLSKLPDKGEKIQKHIAELHLELDKIRMEKRKDKEVIDLDDITESFHKVLNV